MKLDMDSHCMYSQMVVYRSCDVILWTSVSSVSLKKVFPLVPFLVSYFQADVDLNQVSMPVNWENKRSMTLQGPYLYLLLSPVQHQKAYCFLNHGPAFSGGCSEIGGLHNFMIKAVKVQFSSVRIGLWCHLRCSIVSWLGSNCQSRRLQIPHRPFLLAQRGSLVCQMSVKTNMQRAESSMEVCSECWIHCTERMWHKNS